MTVERSLVVGTPSGLAGPAGPVIGEASMRWVQGEVTLVAGAASDVLSAEQAVGLRSDPIIVTSRIADGGAVGSYETDYDDGTRTLTITSSSGTDTSTLRWLMLQV